MTVYVDELADYGGMVRGQARRYGTVWSHLMADSEAELLEFGALIGIRPSWLQHAGTTRVHFDVTPPRRALAVKHGAQELTLRDIIRRRRERITNGIVDSTEIVTGNRDR